ncbi:hypothetical protein CSA56_06555 [candidate division KSB3 bacterium]|uniref:Uncharacterized protein n=1 Tax=candidate division KSB3 bacterium TaxID=2044937 RepID=A0A2G6KGN5_9BACT|nr:MAG: hypothetical protein CSA56_06555 [candidate division KSB3 bacterium]
MTDFLDSAQQLQPQQNGQSPASPQRPEEGLEQTFPIVDPSYIEKDIPSDVMQAIHSCLMDGEPVFVIFQLHSNFVFHLESGKNERVPIWTVVTGTRLLLLALASDGQIHKDVYDQNTVFTYQNGFSRDAIIIADKSLSAGVWEGKRWLLKEAVTLFPLPEYEKYLYLAERYLKKNEKESALPLLHRSLESVPTLKAYLLVLSILSQQNKQQEALQLLREALEFADAVSLLDELHLLFPDCPKLSLYLAAACEELQNWDVCISIYQGLLQKTPDFDLYFLKLGEMYNAKQDYAAAIDAYQQFITLRVGSDKFKRGEFFYWEMEELQWFSADPDLAKVYFDLGVIYEYELDDLQQAASLYLTLIRHAPFYIDAYKHLWLVFQQLCSSSSEAAFAKPPLHIQTFLQIYKLLAPQTYLSTMTPEHAHCIAEMTGHRLPSLSTTLPIGYHRLRDADRKHLIHPSEQEYIRRAQKWLTSLVVSDQDAEGIEEYCEQVTESNFPDLFHTIENMADFLDISPPKCFISRGRIGMSVRNQEHPFIFIGSDHLNTENSQYFPPDELTFAIAAQAEHIKSNHLLITGTELWKSLETASFDGFLLALQCLPAGSFLGKITQHFARTGLKKMYSITKTSHLQKVLDFFTRSEAESEPKSPTPEDSEKGELSKSKKPPQPDTLLKEHIVEFARHAVYTSDRTGLLACNHIGAACSVIFKLAGEARESIEHLSTEGLFRALEQQDKRGNFLYVEYARRFSELIKFALSEEYNRLHANTVILGDKSSEFSSIPVGELSAYHLLENKLQLLEHSVQHELLTHEEFIRKQKKLLEQAGILQNGKQELIEKLYQAFLDGILTLEELHTKLFHVLKAQQGTAHNEYKSEKNL